MPGLDLGKLSLGGDSIFTSGPDTNNPLPARSKETQTTPELPSAPLGLGPTRPKPKPQSQSAEVILINGRPASPPAVTTTTPSPSSSFLGAPLPAPHKATSLPLNDRLAARDRAYGLLSALTKLGSGWNCSEAWFALARAYEESGQLDKARNALWWCVELEDGRAVREWAVVGGGYVL